MNKKKTKKERNLTLVLYVNSKIRHVKRSNIELKKI